MSSLFCLFFHNELQYQRLAGLELQILRQVIIATCEDILYSRGLTNDLGIASYRHCGRFRRTVENGHHGVAVPAAGDDVNTVIGDELGLITTDNGLVAITPVEQATKPTEHALFCL